MKARRIGLTSDLLSRKPASQPSCLESFTDPVHGHACAASWPAGIAFWADPCAKSAAAPVPAARSGVTGWPSSKPRSARPRANPRRRCHSCRSAARRRWSIPSGSSRSCAPRATASPAGTTAPTWSSSTPAAFSIRPRRNRSPPSARRWPRTARSIVTGCMGAEPEPIRERFPDVLAVTGPQHYESVVAAVHEAVPPAHDPFLDLVPPQGLKLTPRHYAYLKISEGCNNRCSFCIIPSLRGDLVSRPAGDVHARGGEAGEGRRQGAAGRSARTPPPTASTSAMPRARGRDSRSRRSSTTSRRRWASSASGCGCTTSTPTRMSTTSSR